VTDRILLAMMGGGALLLPVVEYVVYLLIAVGLSLLVFSRKEMEF